MNIGTRASHVRLWLVIFVLAGWSSFVYYNAYENLKLFSNTKAYWIKLERRGWCIALFTGSFLMVLANRTFRYYEPWSYILDDVKSDILLSYNKQNLKNRKIQWRGRCAIFNLKNPFKDWHWRMQIIVVPFHCKQIAIRMRITIIENFFFCITTPGQIMSDRFFANIWMSVPKIDCLTDWGVFLVFWRDGRGDCNKTEEEEMNR